MRSLKKTGITRREFIGIVAGAAATIPLLDFSTLSLAQQGAPKRGGTLLFPLDNEPIHYDPHIGTNMGKIYFEDMALSGLLRYKTGPGSDPEKWEIIPDLAESYKQLDEVTYLFKLHKGVKWHNLPPVNGREFTADDVKYSFERIITDKPGFDRRSQFEALDKIEIVDKYTVKFILKQTSAPFLAYVACPFNKIIAKEVVEKDGDAKKTLVGTGPFMLVKYDRGGLAVWQRHPDYFVKGLPYLDEVQMPVIKDYSSIVAAFRSKRLDLMWTSDPNIAAKITTTNTEAVVEKYLDTGFRHLAFNLQKKPLDDVRVRQAIALALDHEAINKVAHNGDGVRQTPIPIGFKEYAAPYDILPNYTRDLPKAKKLLADAGLENGFKVTIQTANYYTFAVASLPVVKEQLKEIGVDVEIKIMEHAAFLESRIRKDFEVSWLAHVSFSDPDEFVSGFFATNGSRNYGSWGSQELDTLLMAQLKELDHAKRKAQLYEIQKYLATQFYSIPTPMPYYHMFWHTNVKNFRVTPSVFTTLGFQGIWMDKKG